MIFDSSSYVYKRAEHLFRLCRELCLPCVQVDLGAQGQTWARGGRSGLPWQGGGFCYWRDRELLGCCHIVIITCRTVLVHFMIKFYVLYGWWPQYCLHQGGEGSLGHWQSDSLKSLPDLRALWHDWVDGNFGRKWKAPIQSNYPSKRHFKQEGLDNFMSLPG